MATFRDGTINVLNVRHTAQNLSLVVALGKIKGPTIAIPDATHPVPPRY